MLSRRELFWGFGAQFLAVGGALILLPAILRFMSPEDVGLWLVFTMMVSLAQLVDMGFQPTIARNVAYIYGGATSLSVHGLSPSASPYSGADRVLLASVLAATRWIYLRIASLMGGLLLIAGTMYVCSVLTPGQSSTVSITSWVLFSLSAVTNGYYGYLSALLSGRGDILLSNRVTVYSRVVQLVVSIGTLWLGWGLGGLGLALLLSTLTGRALAFHYVNARNRPEMEPMNVSVQKRNETIRTLWPTASRLGAVMIGVFLVWRANVLVASSTLGLAEAASYGLAIQLFFILNSFAALPLSLSLPRLSALRAQGEIANVLEAFSVQLVSTLFLYVVGATLIFFGAPWFLSHIGSRTALPSAGLLALMILFFFLELNHGTCANFITTGNQVPFVPSSLITGTLIVCCSVVLAPRWGIPALILSHGTCQLLYNNWKWPAEVSRMFGLPYLSILWRGLNGLIGRL